MQTIQIKPVNLKHQRPTDVKEFYIELHPTYIKSVFVFFADEPDDKEDHKLGWHNEFNSFNSITLKRFIAGVEKNWGEFSKAWKVCICVNGFSEDIKIFFKKESEAQELYDILINWLLL